MCVCVLSVCMYMYWNLLRPEKSVRPNGAICTDNYELPSRC